ncbi:polysaccharide deacetylase family protein [Halobacillus seohaensis]|uniref:Polysaccharide deacetylase family protein n=1 Tax=Halobacillus seohaensis TaxID=447421 RepID=A0ABW2EI21_9BACI
MSMQVIIKLIATMLLVVIFISVQNNEAILPTAKTSSLYEEIEAKQKQYYIAPQDARIDKVWKKTPGLNGRKINVEKSYQNMKKSNKFNEKDLVFDKIPPKVSLQDLPSSPIYRGNEHKQKVTFLINVSWGEEFVPQILEILDKHHIKANFFIDGAFVQNNKQHVQMIEEAQHVIGSHGYNHPDFSKMDRNTAKENLEKANSILQAFTEEDIRLFAPPAGSFSSQTVEAADSLDMETILWSVDTIDWKNPTQEVLIQRVLARLHNGATILMHPTESTSSSLDQLIVLIKNEGYQIVDFPQLINENR